MNRIKKPTAHWRYVYSNGYGNWAILFLDENGGFSVLSDYGNYGYRWTSAGLDGRSMRSFIVDCDDDYIVGKITQGHPREYDGKKTCQALKEYIISERRGSRAADRRMQRWARTHWDWLVACDGVETEADFSQWVGDTDLEDAGEFEVRNVSSDALAFMEHCWPGLKALINADLCRTLERSLEDQLHEAQEENLRLNNELFNLRSDRAEEFTSRYFEHKRKQNHDDPNPVSAVAAHRNPAGAGGPE
jgi:hypothetical protein